MAKRPEKSVEIDPDGWSRFERAIDVVAKSPPQHRKASKLGKIATKPTKAKKPK